MSMLKRTRIAVISDLHIGNDPIATDLSPHEISPEKQVGLVRNFLPLFREHVTKPDFVGAGPIDYLCVTGDISDRADPVEFQHAHEVVMEMASALGVSGEHVFFVPGNHDVYWPVMKLSPIEFWDKYRYEPLLQRDLIFKSQVDNATHGSFNEEPHFVAWKGPNRLVVGINSAAFDSPTPEHGKHFGLIRQETVEELEIFLAGLAIEDAELRVCMLHHHPVSYSDKQPNFPDFSAAQNAENLFELLSKYRFDLIIHGHKHVPRVTHRAATSNGHPITILGAGSVSAKLTSQWSGTTQNQFHVINVEGRKAETKAAFGFVSTWNFVGGGWKESNRQLGLCANEGFGTLATPHELRVAMEEAIHSIIGGQKGGTCRWSQLIAALPDILHANTLAVYDALSEAAKNAGCEFLGDADSKKEHWILVCQ